MNSPECVYLIFEKRVGSRDGEENDKQAGVSSSSPPRRHHSQLRSLVHTNITSPVRNPLLYGGIILVIPDSIVHTDPLIGMISYIESRHRAQS